MKVVVFIFILFNMMSSENSFLALIKNFLMVLLMQEQNKRWDI